MKDIVGKILNRIKADRIRRRRMRTVLLVLSLFVATGVLWRMKITGITMTGEALCGHLEHLHTAECLGVTEACGLAESEGHRHGVDCWRILQCNIEAHDHEDTCYETVELPVCGQEEAEAHHHSEDCLKESYLCGYPEEHVHNLLCYSNPEADLESSSDWEETIPALTQDAAADLAAVARSQLGYTESQQNYKLAEDNVTKMGYTRYGEWYGNPYGKWNAMFVSFCLRYAEHPAYETLKNSGVETMRLAAENAGIYHAACGTNPGVGDLVFLDKDSNGNCETVAIVSGCYEGGIRVVEGDCNGTVAENAYALDNGAVLGYALLTPQLATTEEIMEDVVPKNDKAVTSENGDITIRFVIGNADYTYDPGSAHTTHITVNTTEDLVTDGGLTYTEWSGQNQYMVTGTGTLDAVSIPSGGSLSGSGYTLPKINVINMSPEVGRQYTYASVYNWVTDQGLICNEKTVFSESTTLSLCLYESGTNCGLNWVCNCNAGGSHSITYYVSGFGSPAFTWGQSVSAPYIPTAAAVNSGYTGSNFCTAGPDHGMQLKDWYVKDTDGNEVDFSAGMPILESYKDPDSDGHSVKIYARWEETEENVETVTATFMNGEGDSAVEFKVVENIPQGARLWDYLPAEAPEYAGTSEMPMVFSGWSWNDGDMTVPVTQTTIADTDMVLYAVFEEVSGFEVYLHDIAPDGVTDYELDGQDVEVSQRYLYSGMTLAEEFSGDPYLMLHDDIPASECKWYLKDGEGTYVPYDLAAPVTSDLHLYTFNYSVTLTCEKSKNRSVYLSRAAEVVIDGDTMTLTLREGEKPTAADFVVSGVDYTLYSWTYTGANGQNHTLEIDDIIANGATENITATANSNSLKITPSEIGTKAISFYAFVDGVKVLVETRTVTVYRFGANRWYIPSAPLESVYGKFGFVETQLQAGTRYFPHVDTNGTTIWADTAVHEENGLFFSPVTNNTADACDVYYLPNQTLGATSGRYSNFTTTDTFYSVTVSDPQNLVYSSEEEIPPVQYILTGGAATVTLADPAEDSNVVWQLNNTDMTGGISNGNGTTTYTVASVTEPIVLTLGYKGLPSANKYINFNVYVDNEKKTVAYGTYLVYVFEGKHYVPASLLEQIYSEYGFTADQLTDDTQRYFPHTNAGSQTVWSDKPNIQHDGMWFSPILNANSTDACDVYYAPGYTRTGSAHYSLLKSKYSFYTVTVKDPEHLVYGAEDVLPGKQLVYSGNGVEITVKAPGAPANPTIEGEAYEWVDNGKVLTNAENNGDGTITYTIEEVTKPIVLIPESNVVTVYADDPEQLIYDQGEAHPELRILKGQTAVITVKAKAGYDWLVNRKSIEGGVYNSENTQITYTFADVTENITLVPVKLLDSVSISYDINLRGTPNSTAPLIKDGKTYEDSYHGGDYLVLTPSRTQYTIHGDSALQTVVFKGWRINGTDVVLPEGALLSAEELSQYGESVTLMAIWEILDKTHTVSFYINLELQVANYEDSSTATPGENYTDALYGTEVKIEECPQCDEGLMFDNATIIEGSSSSATAATDAHIRQLTTGVSEVFMEKEREFTLGTFPDDGQMLNKIVAEQEVMIRNFEKSEWYDPEDPTNVTEYRKQGTYDDYGIFHPMYKIICAVDSNGELHYIPTQELTPENYMIRWYVFKYEGTDGWHVDGVLVKKQAQLTVTKTFYGDDDAVAAVKQGYSIDVVGINEQNPGSMVGRPTLYTLTLNAAAVQQNDPNTVQKELGYTDYNSRTDTYTWVVNLTADWEAWLYEQNHTSDTSDIVTLSEYMAYNFADDKYNRARTTYTDDDGVCVAVKAHGVDQDYRTFETVSFYNTYLPSAAVPISKVDENGKPLTGVTFTLEGRNQGTLVAAKLWKDAKGVYHYRPDAVQESVDPAWMPVDCIAVDEMGFALVMGLKDKGLNYSFALEETSTPEGYNSVGIPIGFTIADDGSIRLEQDVLDSNMVNTPDKNTIHVTNSSQAMSVTAKKIWLDDTDQKVTLQLMLDDTPLPGKVVELDGIVDIPAEGVTDGYESSPWTVTWNNLPAYTGGDKAVYKVKEIKINETPYDSNYGDGYADYHVIVEDMKYTAWNGEIPTEAEICVTNTKQLSGLEFTKTDEFGQKLQGAVFQLYRDPSCTQPYGRPRTSDAGGKVSFGDMAAGTYYMKEEQPPEGYLLSNTVYTVTVHAGKTTISAYGSATAITQIINDSKPATLNLQKVDNGKNPLPGAIFEVWELDSVDGTYKKISRNVGGEIKTQFAVDATGKLTISDLTRGNYKLVEVAAPDGYYRLAEEIHFSVEKGRIVCQSNSKLWSFDGTTVTVVNVAGSELPETGGIGTYYGTMVGLLMMAGSLLYGFLLRRKHERGTV